MGLADIVLAIFVVGVLIFLHEAGHFTVAKALGVRVKAFSIGFGPALVKVRRDETTYQVSAIPFGGYVMFDEASPDEPPDPRSFEAQSTGRRALIAVAGVATNLFVAFVVLLALYGLYGVPRFQMQVVSVVKSSPAAAAGLRAGDVLLRVGGTAMATPAGASRLTRVVTGHDDRPLTVVYRRAGHTRTTRVVPRPTQGSVRIGVYLQEGYGYLGTGSLGARLGAAWQGTGRVITLLLGGLVQLVTGRVPTSQLGGPVKIVTETSQVAAAGMTALLYWIALLSANLAVLNAVPFPGLDGGRLAFLLGEVLSRGRRNVRVEQAINFIGLVVLMLIIGALTVQDIASLHP